MDETNLIEFKGKLNRVIFHSEQNGFTVALYEENGTHKNYKCTGANLPTTKNVEFLIKADRRPDPMHGGEKYEVLSFKMTLNDGKEGVTGFLTSGIFKGIGPVMAKRIYERFRDDTFKTIKENPKQLSRVKGISLKKAMEIHDAFMEEGGKAELYSYLSGYGFTSKKIRDVIKEYPGESPTSLLGKIRSNPYMLILIPGITFQDTDAMGKGSGIPPDSEDRIYAAVHTAVTDLMQRGHVGVEPSPVIDGALKLLSAESIERCRVRSSIFSFIYSGKIKYRKVSFEGKAIFLIYTPQAFAAENELSDAINRANKSTPHNTGDIYSGIKEYERKNKISLDESQREAVCMALKNPLSVITGGPGTGKTTIVKAIACIWKKKTGKPVVLLSPTGRAARNLEEKTGFPSSTIHSHYGFGVGDDHPFTDGSVTDEDSLVIIDEASMLDVFTARDVMLRVTGCHIVFMGDSDQLPSVGPGNVLSDLIRSGAVPVKRLKYVHRQGEGSMITDNADRIRNGDINLLTADDFRIYVLKDGERNDREHVMNMLENKLIDEYLSAARDYGLENVACLVPFNRHVCGQLSLNLLLQGKLNPASPGKNEFKGLNGQTFREGDPVMQLKNHPDISNGDIGKVVYIGKREDQDILLADFLGHEEVYTRENIEELTLAYAMTVHKSQGSEYDAVITALAGFHGPMLRRNVLYTAVTRAKKKLILCGTESAIKKAVMDNLSEKRCSLLWYNILRAEKEGKEEGKMEESPVQLTLPGIFVQ